MVDGNNNNTKNNQASVKGAYKNVISAERMFVKDTCVLAEKLGYYGFYYGESLAEIDLHCWSVRSNLSAT